MDKNNAPYSSAELNITLSNKIHATSPTEPLQDAFVQNVSVVGALFDKNFNFYPDDERVISNALHILKEAKTTFSKTVNFHFYNLLPPLQNDFLRAAILDKSAPQSDVVIVCGVWGGKCGDNDFSQLPSSQKQPLEDFSFDEMYKDSSNSRLVTTSHLQAAPETWAMASNNVQAKFVITDGVTGIDYINTDDFLFENFYSAAIATSDKYQRSENGYYGILTRNEDIPKIKQTIDPKHPLGQAVRKLV